MPKYIVELAQLVRETAVIVVEAPSRAFLEKHLNDVYAEEQGESEWEMDANWGTEEGTHRVVSTAKQSAVPSFRVDNSGKVSAVVEES